MDYDRVITECPQLRRWQLCTAALLWLPTLSAGLNIMSYTFAGYSPPHRCRQSCETVEAELHPSWLAGLEDVDACSSMKYTTTQTDGDTACSVDGFLANSSQACQDYVYDRGVFSVTLVTEYNLVCGDTWKKGFIGMSYMIGLFIGSYILGYISDRWGRKVTLMLSLTVLALSGGCAGLAPNYPSYVVCYVVAAIAGYGTFVAPFLITVELMATEQKTLVSMMVNFPFVIGEAVMCLLAWLSRDYRIMHLVGYLPLLALLPLCWFLPESPRWLLAKGRVEEARDEVRRGARLFRYLAGQSNHCGVFFRVTLDESLLHQKVASEPGKEDGAGVGADANNPRTPDIEVGLLDLLKSPVLLPRLLVTYVNWTVINLCYYGLTMNSVNLSGDVFLNTLLGVLIEAPGYILAMFTMDRFGRKPILVLCQLVAGVACVGAGLVPPSQHLLLSFLSCLGKLGTSAAFALIYLYTAEMFPTAVRNQTLGTCSMVARLGSLVAPYIASLGASSTLLPFLVFGASTLVGGTTAILLPETLGTQLPTTRQDAEELGKGCRGC